MRHQRSGPGRDHGRGVQEIMDVASQYYVGLQTQPHESNKMDPFSESSMLQMISTKAR